MIIAMSSSGKENDSSLDARFGRCAYFSFYDTDTEQWSFLPNPGQREGSGAGIKAAQFIIENKADLLLTGETGPKATQVLSSAGIEVHYVSDLTLQEALEYYWKQKYDAGSGEKPVTNSQSYAETGKEDHLQAVQTPLSSGIIAVATEGQEVASHFGRCAEYTIANIDHGDISTKAVVPNPGHQPGFLPRFLGEMGVNCVIAGGMGPRAQNLFAEQGIQALVGVTGTVEDVLQKYLSGELAGGESLCSHPYGHDNCDGQ